MCLVCAFRIPLRRSSEKEPKNCRGQKLRSRNLISRNQRCASQTLVSKPPGARLKRAFIRCKGQRWQRWKFYRRKISRNPIKSLSTFIRAVSPPLCCGPISIRPAGVAPLWPLVLQPWIFPPEIERTVLTKRSGKYRIFESGSSTNSSAILMFPGSVFCD